MDSNQLPSNLNENGDLYGTNDIELDDNHHEDMQSYTCM
jgi:hypothetical protein